jgi:tRNA dimethylallyltransferase
LPFDVIYTGLELPRDVLYKRIDHRVDEMIQNGLVKEVEKLLPFKNAPALQTVGYRELVDYFEARLSLEEAIDKIKQHTRNYAKRQLTWFKKNKNIRWFQPEQVSEMIVYINERI